MPLDEFLDPVERIFSRHPKYLPFFARLYGGPAELGELEETIHQAISKEDLKPWIEGGFISYDEKSKICRLTDYGAFFGLVAHEKIQTAFKID